LNHENPAAGTLGKALQHNSIFGAIRPVLPALTHYLRDPSSLNRDVPRDVRNILVARSAGRPAGFN
jgi:hypothetical protein